MIAREQVIAGRITWGIKYRNYIEKAMNIKGLSLFLTANCLAICTHGFTSRITQHPTLGSSINPYSINKNTFLRSEESDNDESNEEFKSVAMEWAKLQAEELKDEEKDNSDKKKYVIVGGGWAGWGAVKALCQSGTDAEVILLDALPDPTGVSMVEKFM